MEFLIGGILAVLGWMLWNGLRPPGRTVKASLKAAERARQARQRDRDSGPGTMLKVLLLAVPVLAATLADSPAIAATDGTIAAAPAAWHGRPADLKPSAPPR